MEKTMVSGSDFPLNQSNDIIFPNELVIFWVFP
jgi:hypothetical protein